MRGAAWRAIALAVGGAVSLVLIGIFLFWTLVALALVAGLAALHLVYLPRWADRLRVSRLTLALGLLLVLEALGLALGGRAGAALAMAVWLGGVAAPGLAVALYARRLRLRAARRGAADGSRTLDAVACHRCGLASVLLPDDDGRCPGCGAPRPRAG